VKSRVLVAILSVAAVALVLFGVPLGVVVGRLLDESATLGLERQAILATRSVPDPFGVDGDTVELPNLPDGIIIGLYDVGGSLVAGVGPPSADALIRQALQNDVVDSENGESRIVVVPIADEEAVVGAIRAEQSTALADARARHILGWLIAIGASVLVVGALVGWIVAGRLTRPVLRLRDAAVRLGRGDFAIAVPQSGVVELDQAGEAMMTTAHRLDDLLARERMFSADVSHQLRTPLTGLRAAIETEMAFPRDDRSLVLSEAIVDLDRLERTVTELLSIARMPEGTGEPLLLAVLFQQVEHEWEKAFARRGRRLRVAPAHLAPPVAGNAPVLRHAIDVLVENALQHGAGEVGIDLRVDDESVMIQISDEGPGFNMAPSITESDDSESDGPRRRLGLPLARRLVESLPGRMSVANVEGHSRIEVVLRRADQL
jgi:signal transduction histidine kinase